MAAVLGMVGAGPGALLGALAAALAAGNPVLTVLAAAETPPGLALLRRVVSATTGPGVVDVLGGSLPELAMALAPEGGVNVILDASGTRRWARHWRGSRRIRDNGAP